MADNVIELVHLQKQFGDHAVLRDINLSVKKGEVMSIIGAVLITVGVIFAYKTDKPKAE